MVPPGVDLAAVIAPPRLNRTSFPFAMPFGMFIRSAWDSRRVWGDALPHAARSPLGSGVHRVPGVAVLWDSTYYDDDHAVGALPAGQAVAEYYTQPPDTASSPPRQAAYPKATPARPAKPDSSGGADDRDPRSPVGPPGRGILAGSASASGGGAAFAMWSAVLVGAFLYSFQQLRRHRFRLVLSAPVGFVSPQQRPG